MQKFSAGRVAQHFPAWTEITNDKEVLSHITGVIIECAKEPAQHKLYPQKLSPRECSLLD